MDHITAIELLNAVKLAGGLTIAIILKPFSFEGQRRQEEVILIFCKFNIPFLVSKIYISLSSLAHGVTEIWSLISCVEASSNRACASILSQVLTEQIT